MTGGTVSLADSWDSLQFDSPLTSTGGTIANSGTLIFNNTTTIGAGTDFQMNGANASLTVNDGVTVNIDDANFNADGSGFATNVDNRRRRRTSRPRRRFHPGRRRPRRYGQSAWR